MGTDDAANVPGNGMVVGGAMRAEVTIRMRIGLLGKACDGSRYGSCGLCGNVSVVSVGLAGEPATK